MVGICTIFSHRFLSKIVSGGGTATGRNNQNFRHKLTIVSLLDNAHNFDTQTSKPQSSPWLGGEGLPNLTLVLGQGCLVAAFYRPKCSLK